MLFQKNILKKYLTTLVPEDVERAWVQYKSYFLNSEIQQNIRQSKEEQFQEGFLRELFVKVLGYTLNPSPDYNLITEQKNETDSKKADGAILQDGKVIGVIELKDHKTTDLAKVEPQAFNYKSQHPDARLVIISNYEKLRLYIDNAVEHREWSLFHLTEEEFRELYLCIAWPQVSHGVTCTMKQESVSTEDQITKALYKDYSQFKRVLFADIVKNNPTKAGTDEREWKLLLFKKTQKLLDRLLFIFFAEDGGLLPPNSMVRIIEQWEKLKELDEYQPLYNRIKKYFGYLDTGHKFPKYELFAYNGGLFKPDEVLDNIVISDEPLVEHTRRLSTYDFESEVDVNILGHIFENSLTEIEEVSQQINSGETQQISKRKQDGVFYTPQYITKYIVENTVGRLCTEKKRELGIVEEEYFADKSRQLKTKKRLLDKLNQYREWLLHITILDPACGSGAFLNAALQFLMSEHALIDEMDAKLTGASIVFQNIENSILENNLYGVDINEESVEIAQLALWLRTAKPHRKLNTLNRNIKCGNSLISDPAVAGPKAFDWQKEFPQVFEKGGFDVVIGNPPYGAELDDEIKEYLKSKYETFEYQVNSYVIFFERGIHLLKQNGLLGYITPATYSTQYYFKNMRAKIEENNILAISRYNYEVFPDANIGDTISIILSKQENKKNKVLLSIYKSEFEGKDEIVDYKDLINPDGTFFFGLSKFNRNKLYHNSEPLERIANVIVGIKAYQTGKGIPKQTEEIVKNKIFTANFKKDNTYYCCVNGKDFHRYIFLSQPEMYLSYGRWLAEPREQAPFFETEKIIIRQTADRIIANLDCEQRINLNNVYNVGILNTYYSLKYVLSILNSKLINYLYQSIVQEENRVFPEVKKVVLGQLPIKKYNNQQPFIDLADTMLTLNSQLQEKRSRFLRRLSENMEGVKITTALQTFDQMDFAGFVAELKKQKIKLTLPQQDEWEDYFNQYRQGCQEISHSIASTDCEIDLRVYHLYGLTYDEVLTVDPETPITKEEYLQQLDQNTK